MIRYQSKNWNAVWQHISYLHTSRKPVIRLGGRFCIIFSAITYWLVTIKCFKEPYSKVQTGRSFSDAFPVQNGLQQEDTSSPLLLTSTLECVNRNVQEN
jgi:hypothetical protein